MSVCECACVCVIRIEFTEALCDGPSYEKEKSVNIVISLYQD
jgi:hypothetical protein